MATSTGLTMGWRPEARKAAFGEKSSSRKSPTMARFVAGAPRMIGSRPAPKVGVRWMSEGSKGWW